MITEKKAFDVRRLGEQTDRGKLALRRPATQLFAGRNKSGITGESCDQVLAWTDSICVRGHIAIRHHDLLECAALVKERAGCVAALDCSSNDQIGIADTGE